MKEQYFKNNNYFALVKNNIVRRNKRKNAASTGEISDR